MATVSSDDLSETQRNQLFAEAKNASKLSYSPYSKFPVGCAILTTEGQLITGCNVENSSFGLTICAERSTICKAISEGKKQFKAIAVHAPTGGLTYPCGACRQFIYEFGPTIMIYIVDQDDNYTKTMIKELLPNGFMFTNHDN
ncbi:cytidine deaminase-like [Panonychus citri]|uniref:cytidine deaminase-like n=1 Tax=Panonychus citri TaxID=50023 RepID=UPI002307A879|nr:cytidine deaminase-like [Panonychus citri]